MKISLQNITLNLYTNIKETQQRKNKTKLTYDYKTTLMKTKHKKKLKFTKQIKN